MNFFCPSAIEPRSRGWLALSQALTWSRNSFSPSLSSKSIRLGYGRNNFFREQLQCVAVVEQEVLQHEEVHAELGVLADLPGDLLRCADERALARGLHDVICCILLHPRKHLGHLHCPLAH